MLELDQIKYELDDARSGLSELSEALDLASLEKRIDEITALSENQDFWNDHEQANKLLKEKKNRETRLEGFSSLKAKLEDVEVMIELAEEENDEGMAAEVREAFKDFKDTLAQRTIDTLLDGEYDANNAIVTIHAGSGGTDAQDWAEMLYRMYNRWAEKRKYKVKLFDLQNADEGGIKSATFLVAGENAYGYLKTEKGVHRIVRISPFDSSARRHTSFSSVDVMPEIDDEINIEISPDDIRIDTFRASGAGGQHVNKTDSAIRITHIPTNIVVSVQNERSQHQNKDVAMRILKSKLIEVAEREHKDNLAELAGDYSQITWGSQIRSYVFHPYSMVKDHRTDAETGNVQAVMDGELDMFINEKLKQRD
ncbi:MAG: peptide chain release factor 2 [Clostridiales Family XIII bacterium]|jgi:peptide chain release factor 2|nr:peptide chain release factor 2 [Clostridiales Family XIII bacterium]